MTTDDKIRDEKLQYDVNREEAKISALSSGKIDKYEFLTGVEILPLDQRRAIEQAKIACSLLVKALEKQTKPIEDQGKRQIKALEENGKQLIKSSGEKDSLELLKQREIFDELVNEREFEINKSSEEIDYNNLNYYYTGKSAPNILFVLKFH